MRVYEKWQEWRIKEIVKYYIDNESTVRATADKFKISKSTVYKYCAYDVKDISSSLHNDALRLLAKNGELRSYRGGLATKKKWMVEVNNMVTRKLKELGIED